MGSKQFGRWQLNKQQLANLSWRNMELHINSVGPDQGARIKTQLQPAPQWMFAFPNIQIDPLDSVDPYARGRDLIVSYPCNDERAVGAEMYWRWSEFPALSTDQESADQKSTDQKSTDQESADENSALIPGPTVSGPTDEPVGTLELIYSLQTDLLDTRPDPHVQSSLIGSACQLYGWDGDGQLVPVSDPNRLTATESAVGCLLTQSAGSVLLVVIPSDLKRLSVNIETLAPPAVGDSDVNRYAIDFLLDSNFLEKGVIRRTRMFAGWGLGDCESALLAAGNQFLNSEIPLTA